MYGIATREWWGCRYNGAVQPTSLDYGAYPGGDLIQQGLEDLRTRVESAEALLVLVGAPRLRRLGIDVPAPATDDLPEHLLYLRLATADPDTAHGRYNALIRLLVSFERAAECAA